MSKKTTKILVIGDYRARMQNAAVSDDGRVAWIDDTLYQIQTETAQKQAVLESSRARHTDAAAIAAASAWVWQSRGITTKETRTVTLVQRRLTAHWTRAATWPASVRSAERLTRPRPGGDWGCPRLGNWCFRSDLL